MATQRTQGQRIKVSTGAALTLLGVAGVVGGLNQTACLLSDLLGIALRALLAALPAVFPALWHALQPCVLGYQNLLHGLLPVSVSCWQFVLTLSAVV